MRAPARKSRPLINRTLFRTIKIVNGVPEYWDEQLARLHHEAKIFGIHIPEKCSFPFPANGIHRFRLTLTQDGYSGECEPYAPPESPLKVLVYPYEVKTPFPEYKTGHYRERSKIKEWGRERGADEVLILSDGYVVEGSVSNIFFEKEDRVHIPSDETPYLKGLILTKHLEGKKVEKFKLKPEGLPERFFLCNSLMGILKATFMGSGL